MKGLRPREEGGEEGAVIAPAGMKMMSLPLGQGLDSVEHMSHFQSVSSAQASCCLGWMGVRVGLGRYICQYTGSYATTPCAPPGEWLWRNLAQMLEERVSTSSSVLSSAANI